VGWTVRFAWYVHRVTYGNSADNSHPPKLGRMPPSQPMRVVSIGVGAGVAICAPMAIPAAAPWRQFHCTSCQGYFLEPHGTIFHGKQAVVELIVRWLNPDIRQRLAAIGRQVNPHYQGKRAYGISWYCSRCITTSCCPTPTCVSPCRLSSLRMVRAHPRGGDRVHPRWRWA
jgi:hypothetical protein